MDYKHKHLLYFTWKTNRDSGGVYPHSVTSNNVVALVQDRLEEFGRKVPLEYNSVTPTLGPFGRSWKMMSGRNSIAYVVKRSRPELEIGQHIVTTTGGYPYPEQVHQDAVPQGLLRYIPFRFHPLYGYSPFQSMSSENLNVTNLGKSEFVTRRSGRRPYEHSRCRPRKRLLIIAMTSIAVLTLLGAIAYLTYHFTNDIRKDDTLYGTLRLRTLDYEPKYEDLGSPAAVNLSRLLCDWLLNDITPQVQLGVEFKACSITGYRKGSLLAAFELEIIIVGKSEEKKKPEIKDIIKTLLRVIYSSRINVPGLDICVAYIDIIEGTKYICDEPTTQEISTTTTTVNGLTTTAEIKPETVNSVSEAAIVLSETTTNKHQQTTVLTERMTTFVSETPTISEPRTATDKTFTTATVQQSGGAQPEYTTIPVKTTTTTQEAYITSPKIVTATTTRVSATTEYDGTTAAAATPSTQGSIASSRTISNTAVNPAFKATTDGMSSASSRPSNTTLKSDTKTAEMTSTVYQMSDQTGDQKPQGESTTVYLRTTTEQKLSTNQDSAITLSSQSLFSTTGSITDQTNTITTELSGSHPITGRRLVSPRRLISPQRLVNPQQLVSPLRKI
ncbi:hypothetical protein LSH36_258g05078 [Paralvinella palmiformis]|uniref:SEA domain-containing protein n=1 Tax=Paralvinella palmiformis TaxID=53620 RepID=A0AAD9JKI4_9ANNE|nr:hypothetical protein LSH36_258g05078 [Paralvinella palmiformis]